MDIAQMLQAMGSVSSVVQESERFEKEPLVRAHQSSFNRYRLATTSGMAWSTMSFAEPSGPSVPMAALKPIRLRDLTIGETHRGRVLRGRLCVDAFMVSSIQTVLEDSDGLAARLSIYNAVGPSSTLREVQRMYPKGAQVAVKEPYFKRVADGSVAIRIENPSNVEKLFEESPAKLAEDEKPSGEAPAKLAEDEKAAVREVRRKGNLCFADGDWDGAVQYYSKCISASASDSGCALLAYSNRAEAFLRLNDFEKALQDSEEALGIDPAHLKSLFRKGRALHGLSLYEKACKILEKVAKMSPNSADVQQALAQSKVFNAQSRSGKYDISDFLLGGDPPPVSDYVGRVEIRVTPDGRGRGLYAAREFDAGDLLLVSNAVAVARANPEAGGSTLKADLRGTLTAADEEELVVAVRTRAMRSQRLLRQLYALDCASARGAANAPPIHWFRPNSEASCPSASKPRQELQADVDRIRGIVSRNSFGEARPTFASAAKMDAYRLSQQGISGFCGLWLLPSFINHSCLPNACWLKAGEAMLVHACRPIGRGEEITISYFDTLLPEPLRRGRCQSWGFECKCRRCVVERTLKPWLNPIAARFEELHDKALQEIDSARPACDSFPADLPLCAEFAELYAELERIIPSFPPQTKAEAVQWIRASFVPAYLAGSMSNEFFPKTLEEPIPSGEDIMAAMQSAVPGDGRTLIMVATQLQRTREWAPSSSLFEFVLGQCNDACRRVYGKQCTDKTVEALINLHSKCPPFGSISFVS